MIGRRNGPGGAAYRDLTGVVPPKDIDVILIAPKGSGTPVRRLFLEGRGINASFAIEQDATGKARDRCLATGIASRNRPMSRWSAALSVGMRNSFSPLRVATRIRRCVSVSR